MGFPPKLTPDTFNKALRASEFLPKEDFKVRLHDGGGALMVAVMLSSLNADGATEK